MRRLRSAVGAGLLLSALGLTLFPGSSARAATLAQAGWWWRVNDPSVPVTVPPPPGVPDGGLMVAGAPDGATALAALHFDLTDDERDPVLTLKVAPNGDQNGATAIMAACLSGTAWQKASAGSWGEHPFPACQQGSVTGLRSEDGTTWTFALAPLLSDGILDVTLTPGTVDGQPGGANGSTFQLVFEAPTAASLVTAKGAPAETSIAVPDFGASSSAGGASTPAASYDVPAFSSGSFDVGAPPASSFTPSLPEAETGLTATAPVAQQANAPLTTPISTVEDHRAIGILVLVLCGGALFWSAQQPVPGPRRLGTFDTGTSRPEELVAATVESHAGLGRFARSRTGAPPPL